MAIKIIQNIPELCECGHLYKDRKNAEGKMICAACYCECDVETLKNLWETPVKGLEMFKKIGTKS